MWVHCSNFLHGTSKKKKTTPINFHSITRAFVPCSIFCKIFCSLAYIYRKTSIAGQFRLDWLRSSYKTFEWGYSVDFLRIEGYQPGKLCSWIVCYAWKEYQQFVFAKSTCFYSAFFFTGTKIKLFDTTPTQFVALAPNIWSWPMWKAGIFMHHDVSILEQVS